MSDRASPMLGRLAAGAPPSPIARRSPTPFSSSSSFIRRWGGVPAGMPREPWVRATLRPATRRRERGGIVDRYRAATSGRGTCRRRGGDALEGSHQVGEDARQVVVAVVEGNHPNRMLISLDQGG